MTETGDPPPYKQILVALDGSEDSLAGGRLALEIAGCCGGSVRAVHVYDVKIHNSRFREMEPGLPPRYRAGDSMKNLRREHEYLMSDGFKALSLGYMEDFLARAGKRGVAATETAVEGRNYLGILDLLQREKFDLAVLGATGLGAQQDGMLGSTATRVLRRAPGDLLIARAGGDASRSCPVIAGLDGSSHALAAMHRGAAIAAGLEWELELFAAYDVAFHRTIFKTMAHSLSPGRQREIGLDRQEAVHEELIDKSLESLYGSFLREGAGQLPASGAAVRTCLRPGKAYRALVDYAGEAGAGIIVLGRFGHNREAASDIGSHAEAVARLAPCHVLVCAGGPAGTEAAREESGRFPWEAEALERLERIPATVRPMARKAIEQEVAAGGGDRVTLAAFEKISGRFRTH